MFRALKIYRLATAVHQANPADIERYENFVLLMQEKFSGSHLTERDIREMYDQWRRSIIEDEVKKAVGKAAIRAFFKDNWRLAQLVAVILVVAALLFPPFKWEAGGQSAYLGFGNAFDRQAGVVDAMYLACELVGVFMLYWIARQLFKSEGSENVRVEPKA